MTLSEIIARLEAATGPDRRLDAEIACAVTFRGLRPAEPDDHKEHQRGIPPQPGDIWCRTGFLMADSYTRSVDDALTLIPAQLMWFVGHLGPNDMRFAATISKKGGICVQTWRAVSGTPALAICIASLKARSVQ